jgi:hypothetical protein
MKKGLLVGTLKQYSLQSDVVFVEFDLSAAHSRIARYLLHNDESEFERSLKDPQFWNAQIQKLNPFFVKEGSVVPEKIRKKMLKVALYTSLNGGNPLSEERLRANLSLNAKEIIEKERALNKDLSFQNLPLYKGSVKAFQSFQILDEIKGLSKGCTTVENDKIFTYTVDRIQAYEVDSPHKIQGYFKVSKLFFYQF